MKTTTFMVTVTVSHPDSYRQDVKESVLSDLEYLTENLEQMGAGTIAKLTMGSIRSSEPL